MRWVGGRSAAAGLALLSAVGLTACSGSGGDKAGGGADRKPVVLTLESEDDLTLSGAPEFAEAVARLSGGSLRIEFLQAGRGLEVNFEEGVVEDVRRGKAQLGIVGVRVWDRMGVRSFQALLAPLLVDSYELERRVLESPIAADMLDGVEQAGVVGIALLPGPLRRPFGLSRPFAGPADYRGASVGIRPGGVAQATLGTLAAAGEGYVPGSLSGLDAVEIDPKTIAFNGWEGTLTSNVVLWPKPYSIVMNRRAYEALTAEQQELLRRAGREALAPELRQTVRDATAALAEACRLGLLSFATASGSELAALRAAVRPVYDELERDAQTRKLIGDIDDLRGGTPAATTPQRCRPAGGRVSADAEALEGGWKYTWKREELLAAGIPERLIPPGIQTATVTFEFAGGRYRAIAGGGVRGRGTYTVEGDVMRLVHDAPALPGYVAGQVLQQRWSVYGDTLTFQRVPGSDADLVLLVKPLRRIR